MSETREEGVGVGARVEHQDIAVSLLNDLFPCLCPHRGGNKLELPVVRPMTQRV